MLNVRIKYLKTGQSGIFKSRPFLVGDNKLVIVTLDVSELTFEINEKDSGLSLFRGQAVSQQQLRRAAKKALVGMGAMFDEEVRK